MKVLLDTCIIVDALQAREPFRESAEMIFLLAANKSIDGFITAKSITDIYYLTHRITHNDKDTRKIISNLLELFSPLDTCGIDCIKAFASESADYEDAVMIETAIRSNIDCIITRNKKDFVTSSVPIYNPDEFLKL